MGVACYFKHFSCSLHIPDEFVFYKNIFFDKTFTEPTYAPKPNPLHLSIWYEIGPQL